MTTSSVANALVQ